MEVNFSSYIPLIADALKKVDPYKVFLFGSTVNGNTNSNSDIDIAVILDNDIIHYSYDEKLDTKVRVRDSILDLSYKVPIDLVVYSKSEFKMLKEKNPQFAYEIEGKGKVIYEKSN
jgi:uncharacterized protein